MLNPQFAHIRELGIANRIGVRSCERRPGVLKHVHGEIYTVLFFRRQPVPPPAKFIRELDFPGHRLIMY
jgi:hypothetical protein